MKLRFRKYLRTYAPHWLILGTATIVFVNQYVSYEYIKVPLIIICTLFFALIFLKNRPAKEEQTIDPTGIVMLVSVLIVHILLTWLVDFETAYISMSWYMFVSNAALCLYHMCRGQDDS